MAKSEILLYQTEDGQTKIDVRLEEETVWLSQAQMSELEEEKVCANFAHTTQHGASRRL